MWELPICGCQAGSHRKAFLPRGYGSTVLCMYANVATGPRSRLKQGFVCNSGQHLHASEHEDEEQVWARLLQPGRINNNETPLTPAVLNTTCKKLGKHRCTTLVLNDGDCLHPCNPQILASLPATATGFDLGRMQR
jgi:hypothetical protein